MSLPANIFELLTTPTCGCHVVRLDQIVDSFSYSFLLTDYNLQISSERVNTFTILIIFIVKSLQREQHKRLVLSRFIFHGLENLMLGFASGRNDIQQDLTPHN